MKHVALAVFACLAATIIGLPLARGETPGVVDEAAFVEHRLALQLSDADPSKEALVLSVANNVLKIYGPDKVAIEVVAFGPGVRLLSFDSPAVERIDSLIAQGVKFDACGNTIDTIERETGKPFPLLAKARRVSAGVGQLMFLSEHGYTIIRP